MAQANALSQKKLASPRAIFWQCVLVGALAFAVLSGISGLIYHLSKDALITEIRDGLARTARIAAASVDGDSHKTFVSDAQEQSPEYQAAIAPLRDITSADPQIAFAYSAVLKLGKVYFVLDETPPPAAGQTDDSVVIMEEYLPPPPDLLLALTEQRGTVTVEPYTDKWGTFISAYAPIYDSNKAFVGAVGVDLKIDNYQRRLTAIQRVSYLASAISFIVSLLIGFALYWQRKTDRNIVELKRQFRIVDGLLNVSRAVGSNVGIDNILPILISKTSEVMNAQTTQLYVRSQDKQTFHRWNLTSAKLPANSGLLGRIHKSAELVNLAVPSQDEDFLAEQSLRPADVVNTLIGCPIVSNNGNIIAILEAQNRIGQGAFDDDDEILLTALASQIQVALEREKLAQIAIEKRQLEQSLQFAQTIQLGMLPKVPESWHANGIDLAAHLMPAKIVGGDFFDFFALEDGQIALVIADVSGKGVPAALFMAKAMTLIRAFATVGKTPAQVLFSANEELVRDNAACMFVTAFIALINPKTNTFCYANGGHNAPFLVRDSKLEELTEALAVPLGTMSGMEFSEVEIPLRQGDLIYLFTDGVNESMNVDDVEYGDQRLQALIQSNHNISPQKLIDLTLAAVQMHAGAEPQSDDITLLVMRYFGLTS